MTTEYERIRSMSIEELAKFLIVESTEEDVDYDWDENAYMVTHSCYATPFDSYPYYWSYEDVLEDTIKQLKGETCE